MAISTLPWHPFLLLARLVLGLVCGSTIAFYGWAAYLAWDFFRGPHPGVGTAPSPGISVLKPVRGLDPDAISNFASFFTQEYDGWEILFGAETEDDPGLAAAREVARSHPEVACRIIVGDGERGVNPKVRTLSRLAREARFPLLLVSDSDIRVDPLHLARMADPLRDPTVAVATCLYRTHAETGWGRLDALALATEFVPGALVARRLEGMSFAMGAGILIRREALDRIGGFERIADCLADDYLLGNLPARAGYGVRLARDVVDHRLNTRGPADLVTRQLRWNLGIRTSRPWSYAGMLFMQGTFAAMLLPWLAAERLPALLLSAVTIAVRLGAAWFVSVRCLGDRRERGFLGWVLLRDLVSTTLWIAGFFGRTVIWRGRRFLLENGGKLRERAT
jgi:ceramide glucosyltransferase